MSGYIVNLVYSDTSRLQKKSSNYHHIISLYNKKKLILSNSQIPTRQNFKFKIIKNIKLVLRCVTY